MSLIKILNHNDIKSFDSPPEFHGEERKQSFYLPKWASELVDSFRTPTNKLGFILQFGYFKATNRFFADRKFHQNDIEFVTRRLKSLLNSTDLSKYTRTTFERHQELILKNMGIQKFNQKAKGLLVRDAHVKKTYPLMKSRLSIVCLILEKNIRMGINRI